MVTNYIISHYMESACVVIHPWVVTNYIINHYMECACTDFTHGPEAESCGRRNQVPSDENTELKSSPFKVWSRSVYCHAYYAYRQGLLPCYFLPFRSIYLHFFQSLSRVFPVLAVANTGCCVDPQNEIGHLAGCRFPC